MLEKAYEILSSRYNVSSILGNKFLVELHSNIQLLVEEISGFVSIKIVGTDNSTLYDLVVDKMDMEEFDGKISCEIESELWIVENTEGIMPLVRLVGEWIGIEPEHIFTTFDKAVSSGRNIRYREWIRFLPVAQAMKMLSLTQEEDLKFIYFCRRNWEIER